MAARPSRNRTFCPFRMPVRQLTRRIANASRAAPAFSSSRAFVSAISRDGVS